jgi:hypothetical protein
MRQAQIGVLVALVVLQGVATMLPHDHDCEVEHCLSRSSQQRAAPTLDADRDQPNPHHCLACAIANLDQAAIVTSFDQAAPQALPKPIFPEARSTSVGLSAEPRQRGPPQTT